MGLRGALCKFSISNADNDADDDDATNHRWYDNGTNCHGFYNNHDIYIYIYKIHGWLLIYRKYNVAHSYTLSTRLFTRRWMFENWYLMLQIFAFNQSMNIIIINIDVVRGIIDHNLLCRQLVGINYHLLFRKIGNNVREKKSHFEWLQWIDVHQIIEMRSILAWSCALFRLKFQRI